MAHTLLQKHGYAETHVHRSVKSETLCQYHNVIHVSYHPIPHHTTIYHTQTSICHRILKLTAIKYHTTLYHNLPPLYHTESPRTTFSAPYHPYQLHTTHISHYCHRQHVTCLSGSILPENATQLHRAVPDTGHVISGTRLRSINMQIFGVNYPKMARLV